MCLVSRAFPVCQAQGITGQWQWGFLKHRGDGRTETLVRISRPKQEYELWYVIFMHNYVYNDVYCKTALQILAYIQSVYTVNTSALIFPGKMHELLCELQLIFGPSSSHQVHCLILLDRTHITDGRFITTAKSTLAGFTSNFTTRFPASDDCIFFQTVLTKASTVVQVCSLSNGMCCALQTADPAVRRAG